MSRSFSVQANKSTGSNRQVVEALDLTVPDAGTGHAQALVGVLSETVPVTSFTDGGLAVGTYVMQGVVPSGSVLLNSKIGPVVGFAGDVSATIVVGDGSDPDRYMTGTPSVFATAAVGVECGVPSGTKLLTADNHPTLTVTTSSDFGLVVTNASGVVTVSIHYIPPAA